MTCHIGPISAQSADRIEIENPSSLFLHFRLLHCLRLAPCPATPIQSHPCPPRCDPSQAPIGINGSAKPSSSSSRTSNQRVWRRRARRGNPRGTNTSPVASVASGRIPSQRQLVFPHCRFAFLYLIVLFPSRPVFQTRPLFPATAPSFAPLNCGERVNTKPNGTDCCSELVANLSISVPPHILPTTWRLLLVQPGEAFASPQEFSRGQWPQAIRNYFSAGWSWASFALEGFCDSYDETSHCATVQIDNASNGHAIQPEKGLRNTATPLLYRHRFQAHVRIRSTLQTAPPYRRSTTARTGSRSTTRRRSRSRSRIPNLEHRPAKVRSEHRPRDHDPSPR
ncbi:hypothetical protein F5144DRAFT_8760 [Chaetomium tenue]|uniref:Uncharacterized protein n=1 Tax=Chaetomium tenue TaxID=1854479 RepID=A0ACB7PK12_9PEZI|nr:hypothetical protein F5144DRAFT_8760 [Chaetomium globosum]